jgi:opacity protein-like surface antigen
MGKIWEILNKRFLLITSFAFLTVFGSLISPSYGEEGSKLRYGLSIFGGIGDAWHSETDLTTVGFLPRIDVPLFSILDLEFEGNCTYWSIKKEHDLYFLGINGNLVFKPIQGKWGSLFFLGGAGIGYDSAGKRLKERDGKFLIGDQHLGGILQGGVGVYYNLGKRWALRVEYRLCHISEPFRNDKGLNSHNVLFGVSF